MHIRLIAMAAFTLAAPCAAQTSSKDSLASLGIKVVEPMSPQQVAETKRRVAAELGKSGAASWFDDATDSYSGKARHRPSGLICPLGKKGERVISASAEAATCEARNGDTLYRTSVTRAPAGATLGSLTAEARAAAEREPGFRPSQGTAIVAHPKPGSGLPDHETIRFLSRVDGHERRIRVQVGIVGGWVLTERRTSSKDGQSPLGMVEMLEEATFGSKMKP